MGFRLVKKVKTLKALNRERPNWGPESWYLARSDLNKNPCPALFGSLVLLVDGDEHQQRDLETDDEGENEGGG